MPNTANYSFPTPADTDLVKNGADAIRDLGDAVDTAMNTALGTKKSGMVLLSSVAFSGVASQAFPNDIFTSTYDNYLLIYRVTGTSVGTSFTIRLRAAGVDASGANYERAGSFYNTADSRTAANVTGATSYSTGAIDTTVISGGQILILSPKIAEATTFIQNSALLANSAFGVANVAARHTLATSYDSLNFIPGAGNISGQIAIYGVNE
jgi:hypothetical protein